jgi:hypothetical protein
VDRPILILVHPGSLCGSANCNLGASEARATRDAVATTLQSWDGDVLVLFGDLCDELGSYPQFQKAIDAALARSHATGGRGLAIYAPDPDHPEIALKQLNEWGVVAGAPLRLTGAWFDPTDASGCINSTREELRSAGFNDVEVFDCAARLSPWDVEPDEVEPAPPRSCTTRNGQ